MKKPEPVDPMTSQERKEYPFSRWERMNDEAEEAKLRRREAWREYVLHCNKHNTTTIRMSLKP